MPESKRDFGLFFVALSIIGTVMWVASWLFVERDYVDYAAILLIAIMGLTAGVLYMEDRRERRGGEGQG